MTKNNIIKELNIIKCTGLEIPFCVSLICPLSYIKMRIPGKSIKCVHLQCFDLIEFITENKKNVKLDMPSL